MIGMVAALSSCGAARNSLGTSASSCYRALPAARAAVHQRGRLLGVRRVSTAQLRHSFPRLPAGAGSTSMCVIAFHGPYGRGTVEHSVPVPAAAGTYAVVAVDSRSPHKVSAFVVNRLPFRFHHL